jgi:hypothetical protein
MVVPHRDTPNHLLKTYGMNISYDLEGKLYSVWVPGRVDSFFTIPLIPHPRLAVLSEIYSPADRNQADSMRPAKQ